jgi:hypothetical protein
MRHNNPAHGDSSCGNTPQDVFAETQVKLPSAVTPVNKQSVLFDTLLLSFLCAQG